MALGTPLVGWARPGVLMSQDEKIYMRCPVCAQATFVPVTGKIPDQLAGIILPCTNTLPGATGRVDCPGRMVGRKRRGRWVE